MEQLNFGFPPACKPAFREWAAGSWHAPCFTAKEYEARLERARRHLPSLMGPAMEIYRRGIEAASEGFNRALQGDGMRLDLPRESPKLTLQVDATQRTVFVDHCVFMVDGGWDSPGLEFKVSVRQHVTRVGMTCCETGSTVVSTWADGLIGVDYSVGRDPFFFPSFREGQRIIHTPHFEQGPRDCDGGMAGMRDGVTDVPVFPIDGRNDVIVEGTNAHDGQRIQAWSFSLLHEWQGPRYTFADQAKAWQTGRTEHGDRRGLVVKVRGQAVVLDAAVTIEFM